MYYVFISFRIFMSLRISLENQGSETIPFLEEQAYLL